MKPQLHGSSIGSVVAPAEVDVVSNGGGSDVDVEAVLGGSADVVDASGAVVDVSASPPPEELSASASSATAGPQARGNSNINPATGRIRIEKCSVAMRSVLGVGGPSVSTVPLRRRLGYVRCPLSRGRGGDRHRHGTEGRRCIGALTRLRRLAPTTRLGAVDLARWEPIVGTVACEASVHCVSR